MTAQLLLICAAHDGSGRFPSDRPAAARLLAGAAGLARQVPQGARLFLAPGRASADTARAAGLTGLLDPALAEGGFGRWAGLTPQEAAARDPQALAAWLADPALAPPGGEGLGAVTARVGAWMEEQAALGGRAAAIAPAMSLRAAILSALGGPAVMALRIDVPALSLVRLTHDGRRWAWRAGS